MRSQAVTRLGRSRRNRRAPASGGSYLALLVASVLLLLPCRSLQAEDPSVPPRVQAQLISKVPSYDRSFRERAGQQVNVFILSKPKHTESVRAASLIHAALAQEKEIGGLPHNTVMLDFHSTAALAAESKKRSVSIVYVPPGFDAELESICSAMQPLGVMTITAVPDYVRRCVVLGFEAVSGKPKLLIHLEQAKRHGIRFRSEILKLARVYR